MTFKTEFPDYPEANIPPALREPPWRDESWHNDSCPSFALALGKAEFAAHVFVDYVDPALREFQGEGAKRFGVRVTTERGGFPPIDPNGAGEFATDDLDEALAWIAAYKWIVVKGMGIAFHPDTHVDDLSPALSDDDARAYEADIETLFGVDDPYALCIKIWEATGLVPAADFPRTADEKAAAADAARR